jgi:hypothetical protein
MAIWAGPLLAVRIFLEDLGRGGVLLGLDVVDLNGA